MTTQDAQRFQISQLSKVFCCWASTLRQELVFNGLFRVVIGTINFVIFLSWFWYSFPVGIVILHVLIGILTIVEVALGVFIIKSQPSNQVLERWFIICFCADVAFFIAGFIDYCTRGFNFENVFWTVVWVFCFAINGCKLYTMYIEFKKESMNNSQGTTA